MGVEKIMPICSEAVLPGAGSADSGGGLAQEGRLGPQVFSGRISKLSGESCLSGVLTYKGPWQMLSHLILAPVL